MYAYDELDRQIVRERVAQFASQVERRLDGSLTEEEFRPLRLKNGVYLQLHAYMLRVAIPYGGLSSRQLRQLALIAEKYDRGYGHFTTRTNIQFNWPKLREIPAILGLLADVDMHAIQTSGNCIRNTTTDCFAGAAFDEIEDPRPTAEWIRQWSTLHPEFDWLGRKFKIAVTATQQDRAVLRGHDVGVRIVRNAAGETGYRLYVGGGLGRTPMEGKLVRDFLPRAELLGYLEAILRVYNLEGRRDNKFKARIKILVHEIGLEAFRAQVEAEYSKVVAAAPAPDLREFERITASFDAPDFADLPEVSRKLEQAQAADPDLAQFVARNLFRHKKKGYVALTISLKSIGGAPGDATAEQMRAVADLAEQFSFDQVRVSYKQNLVLPHVRRDDVPEIFAVLKAQGLATPNVDLITDIICCPGLDYCALATARSIPLAQTLSRHFADPDKQKEIGELSIKISGCINACAHHHIANIGILGLEKSGGESYQITIGGDPGDQYALGELLGPGLPASAVPEAIDRVIGVYLDARRQGETFIETYRRLGVTPFKAAFKEIADAVA
ncbi:sulfite reductase (NADPH) hemoprotein beta-component [Rhodoblastus acidophilus]|uniref:Sulfite reductase (NADPH) hemoprotein beta-component n=1 Tax=Rhodoblastus acidophilus TaxID=1074 RepID=A0A212R869_RHOAC|nr:nitrite/sulfite reductase [Rhodoblastus acidophilus]PPQ37953.1 sulfite reductase [Rhodoblastus acidophilus]RAI24062.1 sulfite reductase [Rhodoblastus acidophilus]SNB68298.1 sulfite reductase (NADPH) hemoprotein beta-component [Rhodoblastus acidophilus]